ncbi:uncharacterized protein LOC127916468 [Oncorhynchus keta]|uniref:uncharacterized protein LOC127916468 n=1 Tax=Oncorhynchus keta TaxID=8018 RepID=UPI00227CF6F2|nr:uncharacterized protein LOC127916468 [Oncorhynchus keta]
MTDHHLKLNLGKTELLFLPGKDCPFHDLAITVDNSIVSSSQSAKNLGVILDNTLSFSTNIKAVARSCRFMLYNIRRVRPCLTQEAAQALVISRLDYCNSLLAGLPACAIKPPQLIQNAAARLVFNLPKFSHVTPLLRSLHWLPVEARIRYKTMVLAYGAVRGTAPQYLQALIRPYTQTRALRSSTSGLLASLPLRKYSSRSAQSKLFAALAPQWWNKLPHDARTKLLTAYRTRRDIIKLYKTKVRPNQKDVSQLLDLEFQARRAFIDSNAKEQDRPTKIIQALQKTPTPQARPFFSPVVIVCETKCILAFGTMPVVTFPKENIYASITYLMACYYAFSPHIS